MDHVAIVNIYSWHNVLNCITILQNFLTIHVKGKYMRLILNNNFLKRQVILVNLILDEN
jgi:hypothetical protein